MHNPRTGDPGVDEGHLPGPALADVTRHLCYVCCICSEAFPVGFENPWRWCALANQRATDPAVHITSPRGA